MTPQLPEQSGQDLPVYWRWNTVPAVLATRTQLKEERLQVSTGVQPVALKKSRHPSREFALYRREDAVPLPPKVERKPRNYYTLFEKRYSDRHAVLKDAAKALFNLNRYAKHETCSALHRELINALKNQFVHHLWQVGYCTEAIHIRSMTIENECYRCEGEGVLWSGNSCPKCNGTGIYRTQTRSYWAFRFVVDGCGYAWHQPEHLAGWAHPIGEQKQHDVESEEKPVAPPSARFAEAKALVAWVLNLNIEDIKQSLQAKRKSIMQLTPEQLKAWIREDRSDDNDEE